MNERRTGLEKVNASVEPAKDGRRPKLALEASNIRTGQAAGVAQLSQLVAKTNHFLPRMAREGA